MIHFVRHGESTSNAGGVTMPHATIPLSERGRRQAAALAECLDFEPTHILSSPYLRAIDTARPLSVKTALPIAIDPNLQEFSALDAALLEGLTTERRAIADSYWNDAHLDSRHGPGADTFREFDARVERFLGGLGLLPHGTVVFGHGIWFGLLSWKLSGKRVLAAADIRDFRRVQRGMRMPNCAVYALEQRLPGSWHVQPRDDVMTKLSAAGSW